MSPMNCKIGSISFRKSAWGCDTCLRARSRESTEKGTWIKMPRRGGLEKL